MVRYSLSVFRSEAESICLSSLPSHGPSSHMKDGEEPAFRNLIARNLSPGEEQAFNSWITRNLSVLNSESSSLSLPSSEVYHCLEQVCAVYTSLLAGRVCGHGMYCDSIRTSGGGERRAEETAATKTAYL